MASSVPPPGPHGGGAPAVAVGPPLPRRCLDPRGKGAAWRPPPGLQRVFREARGDRWGPPATSSCSTRRTDNTDISSISVCYKTVLSSPWVGSLLVAPRKHLAGERGGAFQELRLVGDAPHPHPGSRGTQLTVPGADAGTWWELQAAVTVSGNPQPRGWGGSPLTLHLMLGALRPPPGPW